MTKIDPNEQQIEELTRELERVEIWLSQHLIKNIDTKPNEIKIPTEQVVEIYKLISYTLEKQYINK